MRWSPTPRIASFSLADRVSMFWQELRAGGLGALKDKLVARLAWEKQRREMRIENMPASAAGVHEFQSQRIGEAFMRAVVSYEMRPVPVDIALFRPRLNVRYRLSGGRLVNSDREYICEDNGWTPFAANVRVYEVPGNHDSMVLEPNVRVLVSSLRSALAAKT